MILEISAIISFESCDKSNVVLGAVSRLYWVQAMEGYLMVLTEEGAQDT